MKSTAIDNEVNWSQPRMVDEPTVAENRPLSPIEWELEPIVSWLLAEGRLLPTMEDMTRQLGQHLLDGGAPVCRFRLSIRTLHPLLAASTSVWERDSALIEPIESTHGIEQRSEYIGSPVQTITDTRGSFRKRLDEELSDEDHTALHELKARGFTDYFGLPLEFTEGALGILVYSSDAPQGFNDADIAKFKALAAVLAPVAEVYSSKRVATAIAEAYLGPRTGRRVLNGQITRGDIEQITAAILISDIRDWTGVNSRMPAACALTLANQYFDIIAKAIDQNGGEILKFMGDSVLALFPLEKSDCASTVCENALAAAQHALLLAREPSAPLDLEFGIGMHFGEVLYGNIGSDTRIDFTVMGQAVNTTARIEDLCSKFDTPILFSEDFARQLPGPSTQIAEEILKGYDTTVNVFTTQPA